MNLKKILSTINPRLIYKNELVTMLLRLLIVVVLVWTLRIVFYLYNATALGELTWAEMPNLIWGAFIFDASNIAYTFSLFIVMSILPFKFRAGKIYQAILFVYFILGVALITVFNLADTIYFSFVRRRTTIDEFSYAENENTPQVIMQGIKENWAILLLAIALITACIYVYRKIKPQTMDLKRWGYYGTNTIIFLVSAWLMIVSMRGGFGSSIRPITLSYATQFSASPIKAYIVLNNPFCTFKTIGKDKIKYTKYYTQAELDSIYSPIHPGVDSVEMNRRNVVIFIMESFSYEHSAFLNPKLYPDGQGYTPFLDSLMRDGYVFDKFYTSGAKSIDAMPSILASIPSFKTPFALTTQALAPLRGMPKLLSEEGWDTWFFNGSERRSMGFVAFGKSVGIDNVRTKEDYESLHGTNDYDGQWGIWDEPFLEFMATELNQAKEPFISTTFTITSHHPFSVPEKYKNVLPKGHTKAQQCIAYTDQAMRSYFEIAKKQAWFSNTTFVVVADHTSSEVYDPQTLTDAGRSHIMCFFYTPDGSIRGRSSKIAKQIDIMPTILGTLGYNKPFFAFGQDQFAADASPGFALNYTGTTFVWVADQGTFLFDETTTGNPTEDRRVKAFVQSYYQHMEARNFTLEPIK